MVKLKPCPLCGRKMKVDYKLHPLRYAVIHVSKFYWDDGCYGGTDYCFGSEKEAVENWNKGANNGEICD